MYAGLNQTTGELMAVKALELVGRAGSAEAQAQLAELVQARCVAATGARPSACRPRPRAAACCGRLRTRSPPTSRRTRALAPALKLPPWPSVFPQELELYKKLEHKHVVGYIDATFEARTNTLFIFLEYVPGGRCVWLRGGWGC